MPLEGVYETYAKSCVDRTVYWYHTTCKYPGYHIPKIHGTTGKYIPEIYWKLSALSIFRSFDFINRI